jgi:gamma-glutamylcyclotransferase (GGCT)/AIG2-like uncharacterized protein YtfP
MKINLYLLSFLLLLASFKENEKYFTGKLVYQYQFTDLTGNDITDKVAPYVGKEQHYFINEQNYKAYDEQENMVQLYHSSTNTYYAVDKTKRAQKIDASTLTSQKYTVKTLEIKETVAGYECKAMEVETDNGSIIYYYSPQIRVDSKVFSKHNYGEWNKYLEASNGALPLKYVMTNPKQGFVWIATVKQVEKLSLKAQDFELPKEVQVK